RPVATDALDAGRAGLGAPFTATIQGEFTQPVTNGADGYLRTLISYNGKSLNDAVNQVDDIKAYSTVNLFAGLRDPDGAWEVGAYVKNLFDSFRVTRRDNAAASTGYRTFGGAQQGNTLYRSIGVTAPREFGVTARFAFGSR
ncbi:MAG TPA: TonB-dependent receptor, partial [Novosphingobium sp.]|nr:TonB-dependent receptor [Novosphingobium sp.]